MGPEGRTGPGGVTSRSPSTGEVETAGRKLRLCPSVLPGAVTDAHPGPPSQLPLEESSYGPPCPRGELSRSESSRCLTKVAAGMELDWPAWCPSWNVTGVQRHPLFVFPPAWDILSSVLVGAGRAAEARAAPEWLWLGWEQERLARFYEGPQRKVSTRAGRRGRGTPHTCSGSLR